MSATCAHSCASPRCDAAIGAPPGDVRVAEPTRELTSDRGVACRSPGMVCACVLPHMEGRECGLPYMEGRVCGLPHMEGRECGLPYMQGRECGLPCMEGRECGLPYMQGRECGLPCMEGREY